MLHTIVPRTGCIVNGLASRNALIEQNVRLVWSIARKYARNHDEIDDLAAAGYEGLIKAADQWNPSLGEFSTLAYTAITRHILRYHGDQMHGAIHIPERARDHAYQVKQATDELMQQGIAPTTEAIAAITGLTSKRVATVTSLVSVGATEDLVPTWKDTRPASPDDWDEKIDLSDALQVISKRERQVVALLLQGETYDIIGRRLGVTRQRVQQLYERALKKLRAYLAPAYGNITPSKEAA